MEIDTTHRRGPLFEEEKQRRRANRLCLYCGGPGHIAVNCPHRPKRQVNQIVARTSGHLKQVICHILFFISWRNVKKCHISTDFGKGEPHAYGIS